MFKKILVTLDGSEIAEGVLPYLRDLAAKFDSELHIFGVCIEPERGLDRLFREYLEKIANILRGEKFKAKTFLSYGSPADEILKYAETEKVSLIAMTSYGRGGIKRWLLGGTTEKVIRGADIPVLVVRGKRPEEIEIMEKVSLSRILVPLDGSEIGETVLPYVEAIADKMKGSVTLLHVNPPLYRAIGQLEFPGPYPEEVIETLRTAGEAYLGGINKRLKEKGIEVNYKVITGDPAMEILEYAKEGGFNLIAMSTHGRGGITRWTLGSVAEKVVRSSEVPVLLVRALS